MQCLRPAAEVGYDWFGHLCSHKVKIRRLEERCQRQQADAPAAMQSLRVVEGVVVQHIIC